MYEIYADDVCIYNDISPLDELRIVNPKLTLEDSSAGSLTMTLPPTNVGYSLVRRMTTDISVLKDGEEIWAGRVLSEDGDFWNNRILTCEGELAFLNDTTQPQAEYHGATVRGFLETLISVHNSKVAENRRFSVGVVTVTDPNDSLYRYTNYEKTIECINDKLINRLGGHMRVRKENGVRYLDYLEDYPDTNTQTIEFGKNLLEFTRKWNTDDYATVILPLGKRLDESPIEALDAYLTVDSVNHGSIYVQNAEAVASYGWIEKTVHWDNVTTPTALLRKAQRYLSDLQFENVVIELSAVDLHYMNVHYESIGLLDEILVISPPHGMQRYFPVTKLEIPLDAPENTQFKLGDTVSMSLTGANNKTNADILNKIENLPRDFLESAKQNATNILNMKTNGHITIESADDENGGHSEAMYISNNIDYHASSKCWVWNMGGLGYSTDGGATYDLAITMDGAIVADYITAGTLNAGVITAGILRSSNRKTSFNLETGDLTCTIGHIGGFTISANGISNDIVSLGNYGMGLHNTDTYVGAIGTNSWLNVPSYKGLIFGLEYDGGYMMWGRKITSSDTAYTAVLTYARQNPTAGFDNEGLYLGCDLYGRSNTAYNLYLDPDTSGAYGGITDTIHFISGITENSNGTITWNSGTLEFKNGLLVGATQ